MARRRARELMSNIKRWINWAEVVAWTALIFSLSGEHFDASRTMAALKYLASLLELSISPPVLKVVVEVIRKTAHVAEFFVLGLLLTRAVIGNLREFRLKVACWVAGVALICGLGDEAHQMFVLSRTPSLWDSLLDFSGAVASQLWLLFYSTVSTRGVVPASQEGNPRQRTGTPG